jgi:C4-dicarboxylate-specific signal transduction histidine kinase
MCQTLVQLIVRNLFERTADVRWWATDEAFYHTLENPDKDTQKNAGKRLGIINRFYTVYLNLILADAKGEVVAVSNSVDFGSIIGTTVSHQKWFTDSMRTSSGDDYVVDEIHNSSLHNGLPVAAYATAVRKGGHLSGKILGVLGVFFDWKEQARSIVCDEPMLDETEWQNTKVMLLDANHRIIAASDNRNLFEQYPLNTNGTTKGFYINNIGNSVAFAKTIGYQEYDGLGWFAVIEQKNTYED